MISRNRSQDCHLCFQIVSKNTNLKTLCPFFLCIKFRQISFSGSKREVQNVSSMRMHTQTPGADPGFGVRGGEIRRGVWGPPRSPARSRAEPWWGGMRGAKPPPEAPAKYINAKRSIPAHPTFVNDSHHDLHL